MRKLTMLVALVTIFGLAVAAPALAQLVLLVALGPGDNVYNERVCPTAAIRHGDEKVLGFRGDDRLRLHQCGDTTGEPDQQLPVDSDADTGQGNRGADVVRVDDADIQDVATGNGGFDRCYGDRDLGADNAVGGTGPNEDLSDRLGAGCDRRIWTVGDFYNQAIAVP
jgi:hypothetical protein